MLLRVETKELWRLDFQTLIFFWNRDKSKNLIKQIGNLKKIIFFDGLGNIYDKTQRLRKLGGWLSDELNISKEKVEIAASISKSDLCSELVGEFPDLQGVMGKYFCIITRI